MPIPSLVEKTLTTYVQAFIALLIIAPAINISVLTAAAVASIPAGLTVIANGLPSVGAGLPFYTDLVLRTVRTYVVTVIGLLVAVPVFALDISNAKAAVVGAIPAALAVLKAGLARKVGDTNTAALLPAKYDVAA